MKLANLSVGLSFGILCQLNAQNIVFDMPEEPVFFQITEDTEYADSVSLGGTDRVISELSFRVYSEMARTGTVTVSLYEALPVIGAVQAGQPGITPGALASFRPSDNHLWRGTLTDVAFASSPGNSLTATELIFSGINTLVDDSFFWAVEFTNVSSLDGSGLFGPILGNPNGLAPLDASTDPSRLYSRDEDVFGNAWLVTNLPDGAQTSSSLAVTITAVPEPSVALLAIIGSLGLLRRRRAV